MSPDRRRACAKTASACESVWRDAEQRKAARRHAQPPSRIRRMVIATALLGGAVATTIGTRNQDAGRGIATTSGAIGGAAIGLTLSALATIKADWVSKDGHQSAPFSAARSSAAFSEAWPCTPPRSRRAPPLTAAGLAVPYLLAVALPFD